MTETTVSAAADPVHHTVLHATPPYSFDRSREALTSFAPCSGDHQIVDGAVRRAFRRPVPPQRAAHDGEADEAVAVEVAAAGPDTVRLTVYAASPLTATEADDVERAVRQWLGLDDDMAGFLAVAAADPAMAPVLAVASGLHQVRFPSLAEGAVYFALTQRSTQWFAAARKRRIAAELGPRIMLDGIGYAAFPSLRALATLPVDDLAEYAGNRQRAGRVHEVVSGLSALDEDWLRSGAYDEVRLALLDVPGIGPFTAHAILLRVLGRPDDVPLEMAQFVNTARTIYGDPPPSPAEIRGRYSPWTGWWAYVSRIAAGWTASVDSQRSSVRTPHPVAPLASSPTASSDQDGPDMSRWAQRPLAAPTNSRR
jgi:DNA-3-methyladenine glycosylase II